jgi:tetratricopeptide (TPR) repeat protein
MTANRSRQRRARAAPAPGAAGATRAIDHRTAVVVLGLAVLVGLAYSNSFGSGFVFDNAFIILNDPRLRAFDWANVKAIFGREYWGAAAHSGLYRPLTTLTYAFNYAVLGNADQPAGYHAVNLLLHALNAAMAFAWARRVLSDVRAAAVTAAIFAVHPLATEAVTNIIGRADLLATSFVLLALLVNESPRERLSALGTASMGAAALLGMLCKESVAVLPGLMLLADHASARPRPFSRRWPGYAAVVLAIALVLCLRPLVMTTLEDADQNATDNPIVMGDFWTGRLTAIKVLGYYLARFFWPARLSCDYSFDQIPLFSWGVSGDDRHFWLALVALAGLAAALVWGRTRHRVLFCFLGFFLVALAPVANVFFPIGTILAERLMYLPSLGLAGAVVYAARGGARVLAARYSGRASRVGAGAVVLAVAAIVALGVRTFRRNLDWRDELTLWTAASAASPNSYKVYVGRSLALVRTGASTDEVIEIAERGRAILETRQLPTRYRPLSVYHNLGLSYLTQGQERERAGQAAAARESYERADEVLTTAVAIERTLTTTTAKERAYHDLVLGMARNARAHPEEALAVLREALSLRPRDPDVYDALARAHVQQGRLEEAAISIDTAIFLGADSPPLWSLAADVYGRLSPREPALVTVDGKTLLARGHPLVRAHLLKASLELARRLIAAGEGDEARRVRDIAVGQLGAEPGAFADIFGDSHTR